MFDWLARSRVIVSPLYSCTPNLSQEAILRGSLLGNKPRSRVITSNYDKIKILPCSKCPVPSAQQTLLADNGKKRNKRQQPTNDHWLVRVLRRVGFHSVILRPSFVEVEDSFVLDALLPAARRRSVIWYESCKWLCVSANLFCLEKTNSQSCCSKIS